MALITLWHNPRCSKSRAALALLRERGEVNVRLYLKDTPSETELRAVHRLLGGAVSGMIRPCERAFKEAGLGCGSGDDALFAAMAAHPILIQRPIALNASRAVIGRPPEAVLDLSDT